MSLNSAAVLRAYLGEKIPDDGTDDDTLFTDDEITELLTYFQGPYAGAVEGLYLAAAEGWERKASLYADQADHQQGGAVDTLSQLRSAATAQADRYRSLAYDRKTTQIGRIVRPGTTIV